VAKETDLFKAVFEQVNLETQLTAFRPSVLRDIFGVTNRKRAAAALNAELAYFEKTFIETFIGSQLNGYWVEVKDQSPISHTDKIKGLKTFWNPLSKRWLAHKRLKGLKTPNFFHYGLPKKEPKAEDAYPAPQMTLEKYLKTHWHSQKILKTFGRVKPEDIIFTNARGTAVTLKKGRADLDAPFFGKLRTSRKDVTNLKEKFNIGFRLFPALDLDKTKDIFSNYQIEITKKLIPLSDNTAANGYPLSKLTNNHEHLNNSGAFRPTVVPLMDWYYRVKLPHVFREFYKTKGLVGR